MIEPSSARRAKSGCIELRVSRLLSPMRTFECPVDTVCTGHRGLTSASDKPNAATRAFRASSGSGVENSIGPCVIAIPRPGTNATWPRRSRGPNASAADADSDWFRSLQVRNAPVAACAPLHPSKRAGVMPQMVFDEALHEPVAVIVARLQAQRERLPGVTARLFEQLGTQLFAQESVGVTLVDQDGAVEAFARANQCAGIVRVPCI